MFRWFQALMPREDRFFDLYNRHAQTPVQGAEALRELLNGGPGVTAAAQKVILFETQADAIARAVLLLVRRTFITPFDRSDITDLIDTLDDTGIKALFRRHREGNAMGYIIGVEIYDHLERVMDRFEDVANRIGGIVIEQV